jgi:hypothetical protein
MKVRYGVVANIAVSHTAAGGSIPPIGAQFFFHFLPFDLSKQVYKPRVLLWDNASKLHAHHFARS